jgi:hypothetical protein
MTTTPHFFRILSPPRLACAWHKGRDAARRSAPRQCPYPDRRTRDDRGTTFSRSFRSSRFDGYDYAAAPTPNTTRNENPRR